MKRTHGEKYEVTSARMSGEGDDAVYRIYIRVTPEKKEEEAETAEA